ncbi:MAG TPA: CBS domain-containing protein, partial [Acidobacteriota bacterium]|nr:CBS domain-containing protein [Acidobacteriota bacterium]
ELLRLLRSTLEEKDLQTVRLRDYMLPIERFERISPDTDVVVALEQMEFANVPCLPVVKDNELQGFVSREAILEVIRQQFEDEL